MSAKFICPPSHPHEATFNCRGRHKCECNPCVDSMREYGRERRRMLGMESLRPAGPTTRRLRALACHGWSIAAMIEAGLDVSYRVLSRARQGAVGEVRASTEEPVAAFYMQHAMTMRHGATSNRSRRLAEAEGWHSPLAWADIERGILD